MPVTIPESWLRGLLAPHRAPCVSIYLPAPLSFPANQQTPALMSNLIRRAEQSMRQRFSEADVRAISKELRTMSNILAQNEGRRQALAFFASPDYQRTIELQDPVEPRAEVADHFYIKPLIGLLQNSLRCQLLGLEAGNVRMWEATHADLASLELADIPRSPTMVAGMTLSKQSTAHGDSLEAPLQSAQGPGAEIEPANLDQFFAAVDRAVWENYSRICRLPLILCADAEFQTCFRRLSKNEFLDPQGIALNPHRMSEDRLHAETMKILEPRLHKKIDDLASQFMVARAHQRGSDELLEVAEAAARGRIGSLLIQNDYEMQGFVDPANGAVLAADPINPHAGDVLDELAALVLRAEGQVFLMTPQSMPTDTGVAAIYRY